MNKETFKKGIALITSVFTNIHIDAKIYYELLKDLTDEQFEYAIHSLINNVTELYPNSNLVALIRKQVSRQNQLSAGGAWHEVIKKMDNTSYEIKDKNVKTTIGMIGGMYHIRNATNIDILRSQFMNIYNDLLHDEQTSKQNQIGGINVYIEDKK